MNLENGKFSAVNHKHEEECIISRTLGDRVRARLLAQDEMSLTAFKSYAEHRICWSSDVVQPTIERFLQDFSSVILRSHKCGVGKSLRGITNYNDATTVRKFIEDNLDDDNGIIVEEDIGYHRTGHVIWHLEQTATAQFVVVHGDDIGAGVQNSSFFPKNWPRSTCLRLHSDAIQAGFSEVQWAFDLGFKGVIEQRFMIRMMNRGMMLSFRDRTIIKSCFKCKKNK